MWRIEDVPDIIRTLEPVADRHGFLVSAYGSTIRKSQGRDLDLIAVQKRCLVAGRLALKLFLEDVARTLGGTVEISESSMFAELCALIRLGDDRLIDLQIRLSRCGPQDALEMYERTPRYDLRCAVE